MGSSVLRHGRASPHAARAERGRPPRGSPPGELASAGRRLRDRRRADGRGAVGVPWSAISDISLAAGLLLSLGLVVVYPVWFIGRRGQTPGMLRMRIRLSRIDDEDNLSDVDFATSWRRWLFALPFWVTALYGVTLLFDYLWPLRDRRHQCLHDKWARTVALEDLM